MPKTKRPPYAARLGDWLPTVCGLVAVSVWAPFPYFPNGSDLLFNLFFYCIVLTATGAVSIFSLQSRRRHHLPSWLVGVNVSWLVLAIVALTLKIFSIVAVFYFLPRT